MDTSERSAVPRETDHVEGPRGGRIVDAVPQGPCTVEQAPPRAPGAPFIPDEGAFQAFVGGSGI
jgi:hypothetical protein